MSFQAAFGAGLGENASHAARMSQLRKSSLTPSHFTRSFHSLVRGCSAGLPARRAGASRGATEAPNPCLPATSLAWIRSELRLGKPWPERAIVTTGGGCLAEARPHSSERRRTAIAIVGIMQDLRLHSRTRAVVARCIGPNLNPPNHDW
jgi:hypothetical protein